MRQPIGEKIILGLPVKDCLSLSLLALEFERDQYHTPRIAAVADYRNDEAWLGIITDSKLEVRKVPVDAGEARLLAVYELTEVTSVDITSETPDGIAQELMELPYEHAICSIAAMIKAGYLEYGVR